MKKIRYIGAIAVVIILAMSATLTIFGTGDAAAAASAPSAPQGLDATAGNAQVVLKWTASSYTGGAAITAYKIYRSTTSGSERTLTTVGNVQTYTDKSVYNGYTYYYKVSAINSIGEGYKSNEAHAAPSASSSTPTPPVSTPTTPPASTPSTSAKVLVYVSGSTYYAKNVATGAAITSGSDAKTVIQAAFGKLTSGRTSIEKVLLQGSFSLKGGISVPSYTALQLDGTVTETTSSANMVYSNGGHNIEVAGGIWNHNGQGGSHPNTMMFDTCQYINIHDCDVRTGSISVRLTTHATITNNMVKSSVANGIAVLLSCSDVKVTGNTISDVDAGIYLYCQRGDGRSDVIQSCVVDHNKVSRTQRDGISLYTEGSEDVLKNCAVTNNVVTDGGIDGDHYGIAVGMGGGNDPSTVGSVDYNTISANAITETGSYQCGGGIGVRGDHNTISGNTVKNTYDTGIMIANGNYNTVDKNIIDTTRYKCGIMVCDSSNNIVSNNQLSNIKGPCIWITGAQFSSSYSKNNDINGNTISGTSNYRVSITESGDSGNIIENNRFIGGSSINNKGSGTVIRNNIAA